MAASLWIALLAANLVDFLGTAHALSHDCAELNPLMFETIEHAGLLPMLAVKTVFLVMLLVLLPFMTGWKLWLLAVASAVYLALAAMHIYGTALLHRAIG